MYSRGGYLAFVDFLFILLLAFISMFILALLLINPIPKKSDVVRKAEYIITLEWDDKSLDDVDIWVQDPVNNILSFRNKVAGLMHLDKDDLGQVNDVIYLPDGTRQIIELNREVVTFRGWVKGEYVVNAHLYSKRKKSEVNTPIKITMLRLNPYKLLWEETRSLTYQGQETTVRRFTLNQEGDMTKTSTVEKLFINSTRRRYEPPPRERSDRQKDLNLDSGGSPLEDQREP